MFQSHPKDEFKLHEHQTLRNAAHSARQIPIMFLCMYLKSHRKHGHAIAIAVTGIDLASSPPRPTPPPGGGGGEGGGGGLNRRRDTLRQQNQRSAAQSTHS